MNLESIVRKTQNSLVRKSEDIENISKNKIIAGRIFGGSSTGSIMEGLFLDGSVSAGDLISSQVGQYLVATTGYNYGTTNATLYRVSYHAKVYRASSEADSFGRPTGEIVISYDMPMHSCGNRKFLIPDIHGVTQGDMVEIKDIVCRVQAVMRIEKGVAQIITDVAGI